MPAKLFVWLGLIDRGHHISYLRNTKSIHTKVCTYMYICDHVCAYLIIYYPRSRYSIPSKKVLRSEYGGISFLAWLDSSQGMWQTVWKRVIFNPDLTSHLCALTRFPIFGVYGGICRYLPVCVVLSRFSHLVSTGKQSDPT